MVDLLLAEMRDGLDLVSDACGANHEYRYLWRPSGVRSVNAVLEPDEIDVVALRRELHRHPELAFHENRTTELIVDRLRASGLEPRVLPGGTGCGLRRRFTRR